MGVNGQFLIELRVFHKIKVLLHEIKTIPDPVIEVGAYGKADHRSKQRLYYFHYLLTDL